MAQYKHTSINGASVLIQPECKLHYMNLASRIKTARELAGITEPAELAHRIKVKPAAIYQLESGKSKSLKGETLLALAHELNVNPRWLLLGKGSMESQGARVTPETISATQDVLALYLRFTNQAASLGRDPELLAATLTLVLACEGEVTERTRTELAIELANLVRKSGEGDGNKQGGAG